MDYDTKNVAELKKFLEDLRDSSKKKKDPLDNILEVVSLIGLLFSCFLALALAYIVMV